MKMRSDVLSYADAEANYKFAQAAIVAAATKRGAAFAVIEKCLCFILKVVFVINLAFLAGYCTQRLYEYSNDLKFLKKPANGDDEYYVFTGYAALILGVLGFIRVVDQRTAMLSVTNLVKLVGLRKFLIVLVSHIWSEFAINKLKSLALVSITSLIYTNLVADIGIDRAALDTGLVETSLILSIRFIMEFWDKKVETQSDAELNIARIAFVMNICLCLIVYVLKWISPNNYVTLEVFTTHQKLHQLEATITDLKVDLAELRTQVDRRRIVPAKAQPNNPDQHKNLRYRKY